MSESLPDSPAERRIRVLVIADSCNPEWESIPLVGWSHANALREYADVHIVTRSWNTPALVRAGLVEGRDFTAINTEALFNPMEKLVRWISGPNKGWAMLTALSIPSYLLLEHLLWRRLGARLRAGHFDLVHRITPLSPAVPSPISAYCRRVGVPFVLGPLNGGLPWPKTFPNLRRQEGEWLSRLRDGYRLLPGYRATRRRAAAILVGGACALTDLPKKWHHKTVYVPENGIELERFPAPLARSPESYVGRPLRLAFLGRLVPYKGADMLIEAAAPLLAEGQLTLEIIGFGPEREPLEALAMRLGLAARIAFTGKISHHDVAARFREADLFAFPSVHEFGGAVVLEAMAMGLVPIVVDYGGPAELVSPASGFAIPLGTRAEVIAGLREVLQRLVQSPEVLAPMSAQAVRRARGLFAWSAKARQTLEVYRWVLGRRAERPHVTMPLSDSEEPARMKPAE
jgi:glycosyltransferase involved in cell wall biosynthesis